MFPLRKPSQRRRSLQPAVEALESRLTPAEVGVNDFRLSFVGPDGNSNFNALNPAMAYNGAANEYFVVWQGDDITDNEHEIFGQRVNAATGAQIGGKVRISDMGPDGNINYGAFYPAVAFNSTNNEYLVVWHGDDNTGGLVNEEYEVFGQRINAATGAEVGANDFRISDMGPNGSTAYGGLAAAVAYNATDNEYLVVWQGDDTIDGKDEIIGQRLTATGAEVGQNDFHISNMDPAGGPFGDPNFDASNAAVAYNGANNEYLVVWQGNVTANEVEIFGQRIAGASGFSVGVNDFRISDMGPNGDANFGAFHPAVAYNGAANEYLVVWEGTDSTAPLAANEFEIFGQRLRAATGVEHGVNDFRLSDVGPDGNTSFGAAFPAVASNGATNEYLVVWMGDETTNGEYEIYGQRLNTINGPPVGFDDTQIAFMGPGGTSTAASPAMAYNSVNNEYLVVWEGLDSANSGYEIYGQLIDAATGALLGPDFRISDMGPEGNFAFEASRPAVAYNAANNEYLVAWKGDDTTDNEFEVYGQRINAATGVEVGVNDFRLSDMGPDGNTNFNVFFPAVAYNRVNNEYLVVWQGDDNTGTLVDNEREIFGQRLSAAGAEVGANDFRISDMGPDGNPNFTAFIPAVAYNGVENEYLVVWEGDDTTDNEFEIYGQRINAATGAEVGVNDFRISEMGPDGVTAFGAFAPSVAYNGVNNEYLVVWQGDAAANDSYEIFGQRVTAAGAQVGVNDFRISDMGPDGNANYEALVPDVAYDSAANEYLVAWHGDDDAGTLVNNKYDVYGQRINAATGAEVGVNDFRISEMGPDGNPNFGGGFAAVAYNAANHEFLVAWAGEDDAPPLMEGNVVVFGQRIALPLAPPASELPPPPIEVAPPGPSLPPPVPPQIMAAALRGQGAAKVRVTDAATGELRGVLTPFKGFRGRLRLQMADVNGDGTLELVVRALIHGKRKQKVFDAATLAPLPPLTQPQSLLRA